MPTPKHPVKKAARKKPTQKKQTPADAVDAQLTRYRSMRDFHITAEPAGTNSSLKNQSATNYPFCIQKHAASHLHYDFRLGWNGVLKSWACAKGPGYVVADKRLAIQVEDHPMEYGGFEGIIPAGQYGGGTVMLWDQGTWAPQTGYEDVTQGLEEGHLKFTMQGSKMHGKWALIRIKPRPGDRSGKPNWLLIKEHDDLERTPTDPAITDAEPNSVITGRSLEQIAANQDHVWNSKQTAKPGQPWYRQESNPETAKLSVPHSSQPHRDEWVPPASLARLPKELQPTFLKPQLAQETESPPDTPGWLHELKLDGYRMQARKDGPKVQMLTRSGLDWTERVKHVAAEVARLPIERVTLDGEVVVLSASGTTNFADLQASFQEGAKNPLTYFCFDLLHLEGRSPRALPLIARKELLAQILKPANPDLLQISEHLTSNGKEMFHKACELHAEGIVSKRADAPYTAGRTSSWLKSKCLHEQEFVIGGYTLPGKGKAGGPGLGALLLGFYDEAEHLIYAGRTGTGFTQKFAAELRKRLEAISTDASPFVKTSLATPSRKDALWVTPTLVAQVRFATWTTDNQVRQAAFLGLREDKPAKEVRRETAAPTPKSQKNKTGVPHPSTASSSKNGLSPTPAPEHQPSKRVPHPSTALPSKGGVSGASPTPTTGSKPPIRLTHPEKILDPASHLTKQQLANFYWAVAPRMLPHILGRAVSLVRLPNGIGGESFYQKNVSTTLPGGFDSVPVPDKKTGEIHQYVTLSTPQAIASLAQMSVLEVHPWGSLASNLEHPDRLVIDLDPDESLPWSIVAEAAEDVRKHLKALKLESFLKTTGGKGLHVVIPILPELAYPEVKAFCHKFVRTMERKNPGLYLSVMTKAARTGKIYLDYLRNERGATAVAPYSPRARPNVGVAVPLEWDELKLPTRPLFNIANFSDWQPRLKKDPWSKLSTTTQSIAKTNPSS